jgi:hypothetical protein
VTFKFGAAADVRYLRELPEVGDFVTRGNELWVVASIEVDALGALVICENPREPTRADATSDEHASYARRE